MVETEIDSLPAKGLPERLSVNSTEKIEKKFSVVVSRWVNSAEVFVCSSFIVISSLML